MKTKGWLLGGIDNDFDRRRVRAAAIASAWKPPAPVVRAPPPKKPAGAGQVSFF